MNSTNIGKIILPFLAMLVTAFASAYEIGSQDTYTIHADGSGHYWLLDTSSGKQIAPVQVTQTDIPGTYRAVIRGSTQQFGDGDSLANIIINAYQNDTATIQPAIFIWFAHEVFNEIKGNDTTANRRKRSNSAR
jgi:hypothetical protein